MSKDETAPSNSATLYAHISTFVAAILLLAFLASTLISLDKLFCSFVVGQIVCIDQMRLATGMTCTVRILISHSEGRTLFAITGFFSYMYFHQAYGNWQNAEKNLQKIFEGRDLPEPPESEIWPLTQEYFVAMKIYLFLLVKLHAVTYYLQVYRFTKWKMVDDEEVAENDVDSANAEQDGKDKKD